MWRFWYLRCKKLHLVFSKRIQILTLLQVSRQLNDHHVRSSADIDQYWNDALEIGGELLSIDDEIETLSNLDPEVMNDPANIVKMKQLHEQQRALGVGPVFQFPGDTKGLSYLELNTLVQGEVCDSIIDTWFRLITLSNHAAPQNWHFNYASTIQTISLATAAIDGQVDLGSFIEDNKRLWGTIGTTYLPVNVKGGSHWILVEIDWKDKTVISYDSLRERSPINQKVSINYSYYI